MNTQLRACQNAFIQRDQKNKQYIGRFPMCSLLDGETVVLHKHTENIEKTYRLPDAFSKLEMRIMNTMRRDTIRDFNDDFTIHS